MGRAREPPSPCFLGGRRVDPRVTGSLLRPLGRARRPAGLHSVRSLLSHRRRRQHDSAGAGVERYVRLLVS